MSIDIYFWLSSLGKEIYSKAYGFFSTIKVSILYLLSHGHFLIAIILRLNSILVEVLGIFILFALAI